jgi:hypothetical protein
MGFAARRKARRLTQAEWAACLSVDQASVSMLESRVFCAEGWGRPPNAAGFCLIRVLGAIGQGCLRGAIQIRDSG